MFLLSPRNICVCFATNFVAHCKVSEVAKLGDIEGTCHLEQCRPRRVSQYSQTLTSFKYFAAIIEEHVRLLNELVPDWLLIVNVRKCPYLKLAKNSDVNVVLAKLASIKTNESKRQDKFLDILSFKFSFCFRSFFVLIFLNFRRVF